MFTVFELFKQFICDKNIVNGNFGIPLITLNEVTQFLNEMDVNKASGPDNVSARVLRGLAPAVVEPVHNVINHSVQSGNFPNSWKEAKVIPLHKAGFYCDMDNFILYQCYLYVSIYMFNKLGWMSVYQRVFFIRSRVYLIMYNIANNICPKYLSRIICFRSEE